MESIKTLEYTVPFFMPATEQAAAKLLVDKVEIANEKAVSTSLFEILANKIDISHFGDVVASEIAVELIAKQYDVCLNFIYSNPIWDKIRAGDGYEILLAYIIENRHYLFAAASRMSPGIALEASILPYTFILSEHLIEEADHAVFFENALHELGCDKEIIALSKPSPITLEWIYLMRALSARHPLVSAVCSGLMETSAKNQEAVKGWHELLIASNVLQSSVVNKFYEHVKLDIELGHGQCWEEALMTQETIASSLLRDCLNATTLVAEQLYRWFDSLYFGLAGSYVNLAKELRLSEAEKALPSLDNFFDGSPVFSAEVLKLICHGRQEVTAPVAEIIALSYFLTPKRYALVAQRKEHIITTCTAFADGTQLAGPSVREASLKDIITGWMLVINGHQLWEEMMANPKMNLLYGYILENYYYLQSSVSHTASTIYSCTNTATRNALIQHLAEEEKHGELLKSALSQYTAEFLSPELFRPLPTTVAFIGLLKELALTNWKAYCISLAFLQLSIEPTSEKHPAFYNAILEIMPQATPLLGALRRHDNIDSELGHTDDIEIMLNGLEIVGVTQNDISQAAMICTLTWSFLDGIRHHYVNTNTVNARIGWNIAGNSWN